MGPSRSTATGLARRLLANNSSQSSAGDGRLYYLTVTLAAATTTSLFLIAPTSKDGNNWREEVEDAATNNNAHNRKRRTNQLLSSSSSHCMYFFPTSFCTFSSNKNLFTIPRTVPFAPTPTTTSCDLTPLFHDEDEGSGYTEATRFDNCLSYHRSLLHEYLSKWNDAPADPHSIHAPGLSDATVPEPDPSWPTDVPDACDIPAMLLDVKFCDRSPNYRNDDIYCDTTRFRVAAYLVLRQDDIEWQKRGLRLMKDLAERGHPDGMCLYGICFNEGRAGLDPNPHQAVSWWRRCVDMYEHPQSMYELGVALYTGEGVVENAEMAVRFFRRAATMGHAGAAYLLGDCLLDGVGVERDRGEALEWLVTAGELGHRGARSRVLAVLMMKEGEDYGRFADATGCRQNVVDGIGDAENKKSVSDKKDTGEKESNQKRGDKKDVNVNDGDKDHTHEHHCLHVNVEKRYTIGGGVRNPVVLERRKTIVQESRTP